MKLSIIVTILVSSGFSLADASQNNLNYVGIDQNGRACGVTIEDHNYGPGHAWLAYYLEFEDGQIDTNLVVPVNSTPTTDGECSVIPGFGLDTVIVNEGQIIQRRRFAEFGKNWILETVFAFGTDYSKDLRSIEFKVGVSSASGHGACKALKENRLSNRYICHDLHIQ